MTQFKSYWNSWCRFWFESENLYGVGLFRTILCSFLFATYSFRLTQIKLFYFNQGLMPAEKARDFFPEFYHSLLPFFSASDQITWIMHIAYVVILLGLAFGLLGRAFTFVALILHVSFLQRNFTIVYGADLVTTFWLFYLSFVKHNKYFSLLNYFNKHRVQKIDSDILSSIGLRLIQVQLCIIYAYTGWEKLKGSTWWEGSAVWKVIGNPQMAPMDLSFLSHAPLLIAAATFTTLIFEIYFPVMVWQERWKKQWLFVGAVFHLSTAVFMGLLFFTVVMASSYAAFLSKEDFKKIFKHFYFSKSAA